MVMTPDQLFLEVTDGTITGDGYFDRLMRSAYGHMIEMFQTSNLTATEKATIYMQTLSTVLQTSTQFALNAQLQEYQIAGIIQDNLVKEQQVIKSVYEVVNMLPKELEKITAEIDLLDSQVTMVDQQKLTEVENTAKVIEDTQLMYVTRVIKDKEAALLGLDDVALVARKAQNGTSVYTPKYT